MIAFAECESFANSPSRARTHTHTNYVAESTLFKPCSALPQAAWYIFFAARFCSQKLFNRNFSRSHMLSDAVCLLIRSLSFDATVSFVQCFGS